MSELDTKYRQLVCELLGIDPTRPMPQVGFGLAFFTPEELRQLQVKVWRNSAALTMDQWQQVPLRERIALLEDVLQNAASVKKESKIPDEETGPRATAHLDPSKKLTSLIDNNKATLSDNEYEVVKALIESGGVATAKELNERTGRDLQGTPADAILRDMLNRKPKKKWIGEGRHITLPGNRGGGGYTTTIALLEAPLTSPTITPETLSASTLERRPSEADTRS